MGPVTYFSLCLLGCLILNPSLAAPSLSARAKAMSCPIGWLSIKDNCYGYFPKEKTWFEAEIECQHHWHESQLVSIHSEEENKILANYVKQNHKSESAVWIGLSDPENDGTWKWSDHSLLGFIHWDKGQPSNVNRKEYCAGLHPDKDFQKWHDYPCDHKHAFICKRHA